mgnify:CR=1 FL=1
MKNIAETSGIDNKNNVINIFKGIVISFILTLILLFIFSTILTYTQIPESTIGPVIIIITVISILIGSSISTIKIRKNGIINGGIIGMIYILILYLFSSMFETGFSVNIYSIIMIVFSIIAGMIGGIVGVNIKK